MSCSTAKCTRSGLFQKARCDYFQASFIHVNRKLSENVSRQNACSKRHGLDGWWRGKHMVHVFLLRPVMSLGTPEMQWWKVFVTSCQSVFSLSCCTAATALLLPSFYQLSAAHYLSQHSFKHFYTPTKGAATLCSEAKYQYLSLYWGLGCNDIKISQCDNASISTPQCSISFDI